MPNDREVLRYRREGQRPPWHPIEWRWYRWVIAVIVLGILMIFVAAYWYDRALTEAGL